MTHVTGIEVRLNKSDGTHVDFGANIDQPDGLGRWGSPSWIWDHVSRLLGPQVIQHLHQMQGTLDPVWQTQDFVLHGTQTGRFKYTPAPENPDEARLPDVGDNLVRKEGGAPGKVTDNNPATGTIEVHGWYQDLSAHQPTSWWKWDGGPWKRPSKTKDIPAGGTPSGVVEQSWRRHW